MAATEMFGVAPSFGGAFSADETTLTFTLKDGSDGGLGFLVQGFNATYSRPVQRIFELGPKKQTYYVVGRAEGQIGISRLAAPGPVSDKFLGTYAEICNVKDNNITIAVNPGINPKCPPEGVTTSRHTFSFCLIQSIGLAIAVQQIALTEQLSLIFSSYKIDGA